MTLSVSYYVLWSIVTNSCGGLNPFIGFGCPDGSPMELIDFFSIADDGHDPICSDTGPSEGVCTEEQPLSAQTGSFIIQTGIIFRCLGNDEPEVLAWAKIPDQVAICSSVVSTAYHAAAISLVRDYQGGNEEIAKDYDCSIGFSTLTDGSKACADMTGGFAIGSLRDLTVTQNPPIPEKFVELSITADPTNSPVALPIASPTTLPTELPTESETESPTAATIILSEESAATLPTGTLSTFPMILVGLGMVVQN